MENKYLISKEAFAISAFAIEAMLCEVASYPSPGLVSSISKGAHIDMDHYSFIKSTSILSKYMVLFAQEGYSKKTPKEIFVAIRNIGIEAESEMFKGTKGVNTHKGMIFLLGISCAAVSKAMYDKKNFYEIQDIIKQMTKGLVVDELCYMDKDKVKSYGEKLFLKYKVEGIRGQVESGIPIVFDYSLKVYKENSALKLNDRLIHTLISIMQFCEDSNVLHRHSMDTLNEVKQKAKHIISIGGMATEIGKASIDALDSEFIKRNISPGGSADLLAITVFFNSIEEYFTTL
ncbi:triphosphoribosyl-dephospho-CoA synthase CitG [Clostridium tagluense]|uniref:triphosphoribosyl-dephospho-CoA synthase CitG n=1 Tax=Clostridium tagluense TaxID=360422 RepID=UPI001C0CE54A|nr:triphosphoribosyl-dephospho-CoA synthase CitG [Clostridium tagluense]MBU3128523.1 triphosphoribosyl-dephospho-CoA synthase CitG [Clostridium tagluense]MBW9157550.1 triphosphoribosyl-dephospho-CoA synthase CitG [Clostridium tagluense]WLC65399.1 triphosphoribosyl-dephospho-CoA synthase CitG [Clostridium tagluense]